VVSVPVPAWVRRLATPSLSDCFFVAVLVWLFVAGANGWKGLLMDADAGWHIRTGEFILDRHQVPHQDLFSFSKPGEPWFAWEWLSDVLLAGLFRWAGLKGVVLFAGVLIAVYSTVLLRMAFWLGSNALAAMFATLLAVGSSSIHFLARPHLFTLLLTPISVWLIAADRRRQSRWIWILIPLTALWTNLHGGFLVLLALLALLTIGTEIEHRLGRGSGGTRRYALLFLGCSAASLVNPYGWGLHAHILSYLRSDWIRNVIVEFQSPSFRSESQMQFEALLILALVWCGLLLREKRVVEALWVVFLAQSALGSVRHAPLFAAVAGPLLAAEVSARWREWVAGSKRASFAGIVHKLGEDLKPGFRRTGMWPAVVVLVIACLNAPIQWPHDFPSEAFPVAMTSSHLELLASGRVLTTDQWGDYLIFRSYPRQRVFVDGRSDFYGPEVGGEYLRLMHGSWDWEKIAEKYRFDVMLLPVDWPLVEQVKRHRDWRIVADDGHAVLLERKPRVIAAHGGRQSGWVEGTKETPGQG
jgi:hypothetical protein